MAEDDGFPAITGLAHESGYALDNVGPPQIQGVSQHVARITTVMPTRRVFNKISNRFTHAISVQGAKPDFSAKNIS